MTVDDFGGRRPASPGRRLGLALSLWMLSSALGGCAQVAAGSGRPDLAAVDSAAEGGGRRCPECVYTASLLALHGRRFGTAEQVARALPISRRGRVWVQGSEGQVHLTLGARTFRWTTRVGGFFAGVGVDEGGPYALPGGAGVVERLRGPDEDADVRLEDWLLRRRYLDAPVARARCEEAEAGPQVRLDYAEADVGSPTLTFDLASAALVATSHLRTDGRRAHTATSAYSPPDPHGARWPTRQRAQIGESNAMELSFDPPEPGLRCAARGPTAALVEEDGDECLRAARGGFELDFPDGGVARAPMSSVRRQLVTEVELDGRRMRALLDSGASVTVLDATAAAGQSFEPDLMLDGSGATQRIRVGFGTLPALQLGPLAARALPAARVPIPSLDALGAARPEVILGYSFFAASVVRIDYARGEITFAPPGTRLAAAGAREVPLRVSSGRLLVQAEIEGHVGWFLLDTGNSGSVDPFRGWQREVGLPGDRPVAKLAGQFGAGEGTTEARFFRAGRVAVGPVFIEDALLHDADPPDPGLVAGLVGNGLLSRCDAVVIDHGARTLFFEGPCDRPGWENRIGWRLEYAPDPSQAERPWVVGAVFAGSSAARAGIEPGDRLLEVGGHPAVADLTTLEATEGGPIGAVVPVRALREGAEVSFSVELRALLR